MFYPGRQRQTELRATILRWSIRFFPPARDFGCASTAHVATQLRRKPAPGRRSAARRRASNLREQIGNAGCRKAASLSQRSSALSVQRGRRVPRSRLIKPVAEAAQRHGLPGTWSAPAATVEPQPDDIHIHIGRIEVTAVRHRLRARRSCRDRASEARRLPEAA